MSDQRAQDVQPVHLIGLDPVTAPMTALEKGLVIWGSVAGVACVVGAFALAGT